MLNIFDFLSEFFFPDQNLNYNIELANYFNQCKLLPGKKDFANKPSITFSAFLKVTNEMGGGQNIKRYFAKMQKKIFTIFLVHERYIQKRLPHEREFII